MTVPPAHSYRSATIGAARRTSRISWAPSGWFITHNVPSPATSFHVFTCPDDFYAARLGFTNIRSEPYLVEKAIASPSETLTDFANPSGNAPWVSFTFANDGIDEDRLVVDSQAPTKMNIAGFGNEDHSAKLRLPRWTWTDWVPVASRRRIDQPGGLRVILVRVLIAGGSTITQPNGGFGGYFGNATINHGFEYGAGWLPSDFVAYPDRPIENPANASFGIARATISCIQFLTKSRGLVGMTTGDSHHQGTTTTTQFLNYHLRSTVALGSQHVGECPIGYVSTAAGGATSDQFFAALTSLLPAISPSFVILPGWTYNDIGQAHADGSAVDIFIARLLSTADTCLRNEIVPIFLTPFPRGLASMTPTQIGPWRKLHDIIMGMERSGAIVLDATSILGFRTSSGVFDGAYLPHLSSDGVHPNDAGHVAVSDRLTPIIARLAGLSE